MSRFEGFLLRSSGFLFALFLFGLANAVANENGNRQESLPRFVSTKSDQVNVRKGPSKSHDISWTFAKSGLPIEILQEYGNWRKIRDWEGAEGWVHHSLLSGSRSALITPWEKEGQFAVHLTDSEQSKIAVYVKPLVNVTVSACNGRWCAISTHEWTGWIRQARLWGIYSNEVF